MCDLEPHEHHVPEPNSMHKSLDEKEVVGENVPKLGETFSPDAVPNRYWGLTFQWKPDCDFSTFSEDKLDVLGGADVAFRLKLVSPGGDPFELQVDLMVYWIEKLEKKNQKMFSAFCN